MSSVLILVGPTRTNRVLAKCIIQADADLLIALECNINCLPFWEFRHRKCREPIHEAHTWTVGRPDTNSLEFSSAKFTFLEEGLQGRADITPPEIDISVSVPSKTRSVIQGVGGDHCAVSQELAVLAFLHASVEDLIQSRQWIGSILVN